jgi:hypothetical protein
MVGDVFNRALRQRWIGNLGSTFRVPGRSPCQSQPTTAERAAE